MLLNPGQHGAPRGLSALMLPPRLPQCPWRRQGRPTARSPALTPQVASSVKSRGDWKIWQRAKRVVWQGGHLPLEAVCRRENPAATQERGPTKQPAISMGRLQPERRLPRPATPTKEARLHQYPESKEKYPLKHRLSRLAGGGTEHKRDASRM